MIRLHDTATGQVRELAQREPGKVSLYVCGPTVYDVPHIGHGRSVLTYDVLRRYLEWTGLEVRHVSNITDVDDKIIERAGERGVTEGELAQEFEGVWWDAMDRLGALRPTDTPHATEYIEGMVAMVGELADKGLAYETSDGVYLQVDQVDGYGLLARQPLDSLRSGARVEANDEKRSPLDFALWKKAKPGEPSWSSPWGDGRPGWHTECVVMSLDLLGDGFDLHTGGMDLTFPHHENERAQAVALGRDFAHHWTHHAFITSGGEKMSKSLNNFTTLVDLLERVDKRAYRLLVLQAHYRSPLEVTPETTERAVTSLNRLDTFARNTADLDGEPDAAMVAEFRAAMDDDLQSPAAMSVVFKAVTEGNTALAAGDRDRAAVLAATVRDLSRAVGLELEDAADEVDAGAEAIVARRDQARAAKDWAAADAARDELVALGWVVEDTAEGTKIRRA
ncbi:MAG: cysteinyl-tRNA synthetase [Actinomycetia bacterium]|nr:cysteinyl-tRNA synthetase [Actinomycetes bacterium]